MICLMTCKIGVMPVPPAMQPMIRDADTKCDTDVVDILRGGGIQPQDINTVIFRCVFDSCIRVCHFPNAETLIYIPCSHLHWDHVGDPTPFTSAEFVVGSDSATLLADAYPSNPESTIMELPSGRRVTYVFFDGSHPAPSRTHSPFGPFPRAVDLYGDGSIYLVDAPGHAPGHLIAATRVGVNTFLFLSGDASTSVFITETQNNVLLSITSWEQSSCYVLFL